MKKTQIFMRNLLFLICIFSNISFIYSESLSLCQYKDYKIECNSDQYIVIKNAQIGHLPHLDKKNKNNTNWCPKPDSYYKLKHDDCSISMLQNIANRCTGKNSCNLNVVQSKYLLHGEVVCSKSDNKSYPMSMYIDYDCIHRDLFYSPEALSNIHNIGGYITSVGYISQKVKNEDSFKYLETYYRNYADFPIKKSLTFKVNKEHNIIEHFLIQLQIIENSLSLNQSATSQTCQLGPKYAHDYYAFIMSNESKMVNQSSELTICPNKPNMVGQKFGPMMVNQMKLIFNVDFSSLSGRVLLVKFTKIVCPAIIVENADVIYDHTVISGQAVVVTATANIICKQGLFFSSVSSPMNVVRTKTIECKHSTGLWNQSLINEKCVDKIEIQKSSPMSMVTNITFTTPIHSVTTDSFVPIIAISSFSPASSDNLFVKFGLPVLITVFLVISVVLVILVMKWRAKIQCLQLFLNWYTKLRSKNESFPHTNDLRYPRASIRNSFGPHFTFEDNSPMVESFISNTLSQNGSCRQSNRTLITRAGSRPTITSGESMQTSNYISDYELNQMPSGDELPTKLPKTSTFYKMMRSAGSLRNSSFGMLRPKSLSRQSFVDRNSNYSDVKYSGSQIPLLMSRRPNIPQEFIASNSVMGSSDISPSSNMIKSAVLLRKSHVDSRPFSQSDLFLKSQPNNHIISPTIDTYLEPTVLSSQSFESPVQRRQQQKDGQSKSSDYQIYDHSRISSNNLDTTCQSSVLASLSDDNINEEDDRKRFSMISNHYYGIQGPEPRPSQHTAFTNNLENPQYKVDSNSNESVYESIDGDNIHQSTIDRRKIALPPPPIED